MRWLALPIVWLLASPLHADEPAAEPADEPLDENKAACVASFTEAQKARREGRLVDSRERLMECAQPACPQLLVDKCIPWLDEVQEAIPTIIVVAKDADGQAVFDVEVVLNGIVISDALDGRPISIDPGDHRFRFDHEHALTVERRLLILQGEQNRVVEVQFPRPPAIVKRPEPVIVVDPEPEAGDEDASTSPWVWAFGTVAVLGLTTGVITGSVALVRAGEVRDRCNDDGVCPDAARDDHDSGLGFAHASTVAFVIGGAGAALGLGVWLVGRY